jgi:hypothetical protein
MAKPVVLKTSQYLLLLLATAATCTGGGMLLQAIFWHLPLAARSLGMLIMMAGQLTLVVFFIWRSVDGWAARTAGKPLGY